MERPDIIRWFVFAGIAAGVFFVLVSTVETFTRPGFDLKRHAISMLSLGDRGWVMVATFIGSGLLTVLCAIGLRYAGLGGGIEFWGPSLVGLYGAGLILAGIFPAPAGMGFPPGTPNDLVPVMDTGAKLHSVGFVLAFVSLIVACFTFATGFYQAGLSGWAILSVVAGLAMPVFIA
ncbi:MAG: DUF998 domain-containing protein, partial [Pseudolabrys sp.]